MSIFLVIWFAGFALTSYITYKGMISTGKLLDASEEEFLGILLGFAVLIVIWPVNLIIHWLNLIFLYD